MVNILKMRTLILNGWTIANRKAIVSKIGQANFNEVLGLANSANIADTLKYSDALSYLNPKNIDKTKNLLGNVIESYREYAKCPYINDYLRQNMSLSDKSKKILESLRLAIANNRVSGRFVRGLSPTRKNKLETIDDVSKFIFDNKGFTSVVPEANADYANCFALGRNGVKVIFDVKNFPGYKANSSEVLFDVNAFTKDKFDIIQEAERLFRVVDKSK